MVFHAWVVAVQAIDKQDPITYIMSLPKGYTKKSPVHGIVLFQ